VKKDSGNKKNIKHEGRAAIVRAARFISHTPLPEIAFVTSLIFGKYLINADFQYISEIFLPVTAFAVIIAAVFYMFRLVLRGWLAARIATLIVTYAFYSYSYLPAWLKGFSKAILPEQLETEFAKAMLIVLIVVILAGALGFGIRLLIKRFAVLRQLQPHRIILFVLLFIFAVQAYNVSGKLLAMRAQRNWHATMPSYQRDANASVRTPDIYYFVFDRYGSLATLQDIYNYDNSGLMDYLSGQGFVNRPAGQANYPFTMQSISSTMSMQYHTDIGEKFGKDSFQSAFPYRTILNDPPIAQLLKQNGYEYNQVSSWWDFTRVGIKADSHPTISFRLRVLGKSFYMSDLGRDIINKSILSPWLKKGLSFGNFAVIKYDQDKNPRQSFFAQKDAVKQLAATKHAKPQFTFAHFLSPHDPYIFDADGSEPTYDGNRTDNGIDEREKYVRAVTYLNTQITDMMGYIREHSPNAVIIIQSDEGPYPKEFRHRLTPDHYYDPSTLPLLQEKQKFGILASYYMPGMNAEMITEEINASVNPFRFVLKHYLGYELEMLPDCQFSAGNKFGVFRFKNETNKLQTNPPTACESL
jgi:hypothetical protein